MAAKWPTGQHSGVHELRGKNAGLTVFAEGDEGSVDGHRELHRKLGRDDGSDDDNAVQQ